MNSSFNLFAERGSNQRGATSTNQHNNIMPVLGLGANSFLLSNQYRGVQQILEEDDAQGVLHA